MARWHKGAMAGLAAGIVAALSFTSFKTPADAAPPAAPPGPPSPAVPILNTKSAWHVFDALKPPMVQYDGGPKPITSKYRWVDKETPLAPEGWNLVKFSDTSWLRGPATTGPHSPYVSNLYLRSRFDVTDPDQVRNLNLSVTYHGGAIVFVNGHEVGRGNLAKDAKDSTALAEPYPTSVFVMADGKIVLDFWGYKGPKEEVADRNRTLNVPIPASDLHKGANVVAIEVIRAPYDKVIADYWARQPHDDRELGEKAIPYDLNWDTCEVEDATLSAASAAGLTPDVARPKELQAWNKTLLDDDFSTDTGSRSESISPVEIKGPRNGWSSGKIVIGSGKPIEDLKVTCTDLKQAAAAIPSADIRVRYAVPFADKPAPNTILDTLLETPLAKFPVIGNGAVVPIWFTVKIPANAQPGDYTGQAVISAAGEAPITVPISLSVAGFTEPDTQNYATWIELMQSPDTLAAEYNVPLWSDKHWQLMNDSMRYIAEAGSRVVQIPLIAQTNSGNEQSMVRFIKKPDGTYDYDLSIVDRYLDMAVKNMGKPKYVAFIAWELYLSTPAKEVTNRDPSSELSWQAARWDLRGKGPAVTAEDPVTKELSTINLPRFEDAASRPIWKPLFDKLHADMAKRGLENTMLLGMASDLWPDKQEIETLEAVSGNLNWINHTHQGPMGARLAPTAGKPPGEGKVVYTAYVWPNEYPKDPPLTPEQAKDPKTARTYGWDRPELNVEFRRFSAYNDWLLPAVMLFPELQITGKQRGLGRIGADFWPVVKDKRGERRGWVWDKYPASKWHSCNLYSHMLNPGPDGPVATPRYEMLREGVQQCEARITIEKVLTNDSLKSKLPPDLAARAQQLLDDRIWQELKGFSSLQLTNRIYTTYIDYGKIFYYAAGGEAGSRWYAGSGWQDNAQELYNLAAEVEQKAGGHDVIEAAWKKTLPATRIQ